MVSSGTKEHLDFVTHFCEEGEAPSFDIIHETIHDQFSQIKLNLSGACPLRKYVDVKVSA